MVQFDDCHGPGPLRSLWPAREGCNGGSSGRLQSSGHLEFRPWLLLVVSLLLVQQHGFEHVAQNVWQWAKAVFRDKELHYEVESSAFGCKANAKSGLTMSLSRSKMPWPKELTMLRTSLLGARTLLGTSAALLVTSALLVVTRSY